MIHKALAFLPNEDVAFRIKRDGQEIERNPFPKACVPGVGDRVILEGTVLVCVARQIELREGKATVTVDLRSSMPG